ncbi:MAG: RNA-directed DNA polymerase, partial [Fimbriimonadaceae bacterium]
MGTPTHPLSPYLRPIIGPSMCGLQGEGQGLPQGLVASGFLANAYLVPIDELFGSFIGKKVNGLHLLDYCRYVDDLRFVFAVPPSRGLNDAEEKVLSVTGWIESKLRSKCGGLPEDKHLKIQEAKTELTAWEDLALRGRISQEMHDVQRQISVVPDVQSLQQTTQYLDHLLNLADAMETKDTTKGNKLRLSRVTNPRSDVRDDTVKRFAANRIRKVLRQRRMMSGVLDDATTPMNGERLPLDSIDHDMESNARTLVASWARNPALVTVLRCALDLFPNRDLLRSVLDALRSKMSADNPQPESQRMVALYVAADILKAGAVETGYATAGSYPRHSDLEGYRHELASFAAEMIAARLPWYVCQQAALFLAVNKVPFNLAPFNLAGRSDLRSYQLLLSILRYAEIKKDEDLVLPIALVAQQIAPDHKQFAKWFGRHLAELSEDRQISLLTALGLLRPDLLYEVVNEYPERSEWQNASRAFLNLHTKVSKHQRLSDLGKEPINLAIVCQNRNNPFIYESALLKLASGIVAQLDGDLPLSQISLSSIEVRCRNWGRVQDPNTKLEVTVRPAAQQIPQELGRVPHWYKPTAKWAFTLGRLLRSALTGFDDYTRTHHDLTTTDSAYYVGLTSTWFKRRYGLRISIEGVGIEPVPLSPWVNELILNLVQWPGLDARTDHIPQLKAVNAPLELLAVIHARQQQVQHLYAPALKLPICTLRMASPGVDPTRFRVALVQTLLPRDSDFTNTDPTHWTASFRRKHRAHIASVCRLIHEHLQTLNSALDGGSRFDRLDLIAFPELSIHPDDVDLLRGLSDQTKAAIFAGLTFRRHPTLRKPVNSGLWLVRQQTALGRRIVTALQGKQHLIDWERHNGVISYRPYQLLVEFESTAKTRFCLSGAVCYDATDLKLASDLRDTSDFFVVCALNKDVNTFDTMAEALQFHMYQPVAVVNTGQYGGSGAMAPFRDPNRRLLAHIHGNSQAAVCFFEVNLTTFKSQIGSTIPPERKHPPAGYSGRD